ncbi:MAG: 50S ribosomal protein L17 [Candidatus Gracilibacteria bacterium]|nr:50S ribosomal protein L17 [Candidatus Gracilibacteria bacterium]MDD5179438.1 50S ribosomal protein L17 [Candidatus Gracilibacteria bacterium]
MRHRVKQASKLGRKPDHRRLLLRNLATSLILHNQVVTSSAKAKALQPMIERIIRNTKKKAEAREAIRYLRTIFLNEVAEKKMLTEIKAKYATRTSGFTRITPLGNQSGDNSPKVQIALV